MTFGRKSPIFGPSYRTRNILFRFGWKSPTFGPFYRTRNILPRFSCKSPTFGPFYRTRNILDIEPLATPERLSTVSSPFLSLSHLYRYSSRSSNHCTNFCFCLQWQWVFDCTHMYWKICYDYLPREIENMVLKTENNYLHLCSIIDILTHECTWLFCLQLGWKWQSKANRFS